MTDQPYDQASKRLALPHAVALAAAALALSAVASPAHAAERSVPEAKLAAVADGSVTLRLGSGGAARALVAHGVSFRALAPARKRDKRLVLPVRASSFRKRVIVLRLAGRLVVKTEGRAVVLRASRVELRPRRATVTAAVAGRRVRVFAATYRPGKVKRNSATATARLAGARLTLAPSGARLLRTRLGVDGVKVGRLGRLGVHAAPADDGSPRSGPLGKEPPRKRRPPSAVDVSGISIEWYPRDSWVRYLSSGVGARDGISVGAGAAKLPPLDTPSHPCADTSYSGSGSFDYGFRLAAQSGWYDPGSGAAALYGRGSVRFVWQGHGIDLEAANPEIELDGDSSRAIFEFSGKRGTAYHRRRADFLALELAGQPSISGKVRTYTAVRGRLTKSGQAVFAGFYPPPNDSFGCVSVSFTTP
jgi:hypothetical protein